MRGVQLFAALLLCALFCMLSCAEGETTDGNPRPGSSDAGRKDSGNKDGSQDGTSDGDPPDPDAGMDSSVVDAGPDRILEDGRCEPTTCELEGKNCGDIDDGCGGTLSCGTCTSPQTCGGGGTANVCGGGGGPSRSG